MREIIANTFPQHSKTYCRKDIPLLLLDDLLPKTCSLFCNFIMLSKRNLTIRKENHKRYRVEHTSTCLVNHGRMTRLADSFLQINNKQPILSNTKFFRFLSIRGLMCMTNHNLRYFLRICKCS